jgi:protein NUD1
MPRLRILRMSGNRLQELNAGPFPNLRTFYADGNALGPVLKAHRLTKLENLSLRNQAGRPGL